MSARMLAGFPYPVPGVDWRGGKTHQGELEKPVDRLLNPDLTVLLEKP